MTTTYDVPPNEFDEAMDALEREDNAAEPFASVPILAGEPKPPPAVLVEKVIIERDINAIVAHGGSAKSTIALHIAVCVAVGRDVFGTRSVTRSGPVLLVCPEDGEASVRMILDATVEAMELSEQDRELLSERLHMVTDDETVSITQDTSRLAATVRQHGAILVLLDPLGILLAGEPENDNDVAQSTLNALRRDVCRGENCTILLTHHNRKPGRGDIGEATVYDTRGASGWVNGCRLVWTGEKRDELITLRGGKTNLLKPGERHELRLEIEPYPDNDARWFKCSVTDANRGATSTSLTAGIGRAINENERRALAALDDQHEPDMRLSHSRWKDDSGITSGNTFKDVKKRLLDAGLIVAETTGRRNPNGRNPIYRYGIADPGRQALRTGWVTNG